MVSFTIRTIQFLLYVAIAAGLLVAVIWTLNRAIQFVGDQLGFEVGDFFGWLKSKLPKRKRRG